MRLLILFFAAVQGYDGFFVDPACPDYDLSLTCTSLCETDFINCAGSCSDNDCLLVCNREFAECNDACPCHTDCLNGCTDCNNPICFCNDDANDENLDNCVSDLSNTFGKCRLSCNDELDCQTTCSDDFDTNFLNCPCQENCPLGCPCPNYNCTIEAEMAVLVLSTSKSTNVPILLLSDGGIDENLEFKLGEGTQVYHSCSAILNNQMYVFGGSGQKKQVSKVIDCELTRIGDLSFEFYWGACGTFKFPEERIMLCFAETGKTTCESYDGEIFHQHGNSKVEHYEVSLANSYGSPLVVGGVGTNKVEKFDISTNVWTEVADYAFGTVIYNYGTGVTTTNGAIIAGGLLDDGTGIIASSAIIAAYNETGWIKIGDLHSTRTAFRTIINNNKVYVIGGNPGLDKSTEIWSLDDDSFVIKLAEPQLTTYNGYPELWLVDRNFCINK